MSAQDPSLSAVVVMRPAAGGSLTGREEITAATVGQYLPDPRAAAVAQAFFREAGFAVGDLHAISFPIIASRSRFESVFGDALEVRSTPSSGDEAVIRATGGRELPLGSLPDDVAAALQAVTFTPPPDFGPTGY